MVAYHILHVPDAIKCKTKNIMSKKSNRKISERDKIDIPYIDTHDPSLSSLGAYTLTQVVRCS